MGGKSCKIQKPSLSRLTNSESENFKMFDRESKRPLPFCCCFIPKTKQILSISNLYYQVNVNHGFIIVTMIQTYENTLEEDTDLEYIFSTRNNAAFIKLEVEFGDKKLLGLIKEKQEAQQEYLQGVQEGKTMLYSDKDDEFPDIIRVKLGNLAPKTRLVVNYQYIQPLEVSVNEFWRIELEQVVHPRYQLEPHNIKAFKSLEKFINFGSFNYNNFRQDINIIFDLPTPITFCQSPTHKIVRLEKGKINRSDQVLLDPNYQENFQADKRFVLLFQNFQIHEPIVSLSCTDKDELKQEQYCATISFIPKFNPLSLDDAYQAFLEQQDLNAQEFQYEQKGEYIFLLDRSGSMSGNRINKAKEAICLFIKSLPQDSYFNVVSFGSEYEKLWPVTQKYSKESASEALEKVQKMKADLGGTEIYCPLENDIYSCKRQEGYPLNIFILTDGEVSPDPVVQLVKQQSKPNIKVYCLGIGQGCSKFLVEKVSIVGNGKFHFIDDDEDLNSKVIDLLQDSITPQLENFELEHNLKNPYCMIPNPSSVKCLKKNNQFLIQILFPKQEKDKISFMVKYYDPQIKQQCQFEINFLQSLASKQQEFHKLAAYRIISILEDAYLYDDEQVENLLFAKQTINIQDIVGISVTHQVLSRATAFICEIANPNDDLREKLKQKIIVEQNTSNLYQNEGKCKTKAKKSSMGVRKLCAKRQKDSSMKLYSMKLSQGSGNNDQCMAIQDEKSPTEQFVDFNYKYEKRDQEQIQNELSDQDKSPTDIKVPAFIKKRSEQRYLREQEQIKINKQKQLELEQEQDNTETFENVKQDNIQQQKNIDIATIEILKYAEIDGQFNPTILNLFNFIQFVIPEGLTEGLWINIIVINYLEQKCQKDKVIWQLIVKKTIDLLTKINIKHQVYREQVLELIKGEQ